MHIAAFQGHLNVAKALLCADADPDMENNNGDTALHLAAEQKNIDIIYLLQKVGVRQDHKNNEGCTPLFLAINGCHVDTALVSKHCTKLFLFGIYT